MVERRSTLFIIAEGIGLGISGAGILFMPSEEERMADLWKKERGLPEKKQSSLKLTPTFGLLSAGLTGTF